MTDEGHNNGFEVETIDQQSGDQTSQSAVADLGAVNVELELPKLDNPNHPQIPETSTEYLAREINGVTDLELLSFVMDDPDFFAILEGEAGVGKNMSIDKVCEAANWPRLRVNFSVGTTYESLVGRYAPAGGETTEEKTVERTEAVQNTAQRLFEQNEGMTMDKAMNLASQSVPEGSSFQWVDGLLTKAVKNGYVFVADEINAADNEAIMPLNGLTEDRNSRYLTIEERSEVITPHENFRLVATRNPVEYAGVSEMNSALESRGYIIPYDYHEEEALTEIVRNRTDVVQNESEETLEQIVTLVDDIRRQEQSGNDIITKVSSRDLLKIGRLTDIMSAREACKTVLMGVADETDKASIRELINGTKFQ